MKPITVLLVDDQTLIRDGLRALLGTYPDLVVVAEAQNGADAYEQVKIHRPQVVLMDIRMPLMGGVEATHLIKNDFPETAVLVLTTFDDDESILGAITHGAIGYLLKDIGGAKLADAIRDAARGSVILPGNIAAKITRHIGRPGKPEVTPSDFTRREQDIIRLLMQGKSNQDIANTLFLTIGTVKNYMSQIYSKAGVSDRANAVLYFRDMGF
ncbi:MAG: response regulator transcription factor [Bacillota bacterium]|nr:response regulator transcription factor [Bacillota bacterium]HHT91871.1 response regulator transcription factor [Bacillota bacterium]